MKKINIFVIRLKRNLLPLLFLIFTISLVIFSSSNLEAAKSGLKLWASSVVPSLFPFFVATELLSYTNIPYLFGRVFKKFMKPIFNVRGEGSFALIMGWLSGYPVGAKIACNFRKSQVCSKEECERLLRFTNNSGPLFIIGTVGISLYGNYYIGILLMLTHILACITVGIIFRFWKSTESANSNVYSNDKNNKLSTYVNFSNLGEILSKSITNSISTLLMIGGFVVLFSIIISIMNSTNLTYILSIPFGVIFKFLKLPTSFIEPLITGVLEITNGISTISLIHVKNISLNIIFTAFLLGMGGISVFLQVLSITSKTDLSIKPYIYGKILQGIFASFYTAFFIYIFPFFNLNL